MSHTFFLSLGTESGSGDKGEVMELNDQIQLIRKELTESQLMISRLTDERSGLQLQLRQLEVCLHLYVNEHFRVLLSTIGQHNLNIFS